MKVLGFPLFLVGRCLALLRRQKPRGIGLSLLWIGRTARLATRYAPLALVAASALLLGCGVVAWARAYSIGEMTFVARPLVALGQPAQLASLLRTLGIVSAIVGGLLTVVMVRRDSSPFQRTKNVTWFLVAVAGLTFAASVGVLTQAEGLSTVSSIWNSLDIDITASDARALLTSAGTAGIIFGSTILLILICHQRKLRAEEEGLYQDGQSLGRTVFKLSLAGVAVAFLLCVCLVCFHWLRGATFEGSVGMMIEDGKAIVGILGDPKSISTLFERLQGGSANALK